VVAGRWFGRILQNGRSLDLRMGWRRPVPDATFGMLSGTERRADFRQGIILGDGSYRQDRSLGRILVAKRYRVLPRVWLHGDDYLEGRRGQDLRRAI